LKLGRRDEAIQTLQQGFTVADDRGDNIPRDEMAKLLRENNAEVPAPKTAAVGEPGDGFRCQRPGCMYGSGARQLAKPPFAGDVGQRIYETVCADCWQEWLKNYSIKVINELRLDLSTDRGAEEYDRYMKEFLGLE